MPHDRSQVSCFTKGPQIQSRHYVYFYSADKAGEEVPKDSASSRSRKCVHVQQLSQKQFHWIERTEPTEVESAFVISKTLELGERKAFM